MPEGNPLATSALSDPTLLVCLIIDHLRKIAEDVSEDLSRVSQFQTVALESWVAGIDDRELASRILCCIVGLTG
jgi:hypothetical protein